MVSSGCPDLARSGCVLFVFNCCLVTDPYKNASMQTKPLLRYPKQKAALILHGGLHYGLRHVGHFADKNTSRHAGKLVSSPTWSR